MKFFRRITDWLETHWVTPTYSGWLLLGLSLFFFGAATNTMSGWLYVMSGVMFALLVIGAILPERSLHRIRIRRQPITPVHAGDVLTIELAIDNQTRQPKTLIQLQDNLPKELGQPSRTAIEQIPPQGSYLWRYECPTPQRGIYRWQTIDRRTAAPLGLFWCRRSQKVKSVAIVYPTVLPLSNCPIVNALGQDSNTQLINAYQTQNASQDLTRTLRPYRWGDSMRLIHWRTSARYGELRVRELETYTGGQEIIVALDNGTDWETEAFEQAVVAAASLYCYALRHQMRVSLWTTLAQVSGEQTVLELLADIQANQTGENDRPHQPILWLTQNPDSLSDLPSGSRWILWQRSGDRNFLSNVDDHSSGKLQSIRGLMITSDDSGEEISLQQSLQMQLQKQI